VVRTCLGNGDPIDANIARDPRIARTHAIVLSAATGLLAERGYSGFSVDAVVQRTGVSKTTIYRHWPSRDDLLIAVITQLEDSGPLPDTGSVRQDLLLFFAGRVRVAHTQQWERCMPALVEAAALDPQLARIVTTLTTRFLSQIETLLLRGRDRGEVRDNVSLDLAASALMGPFVFRRLLLHKTPTSAQVAAVLDMLLHGISQARPPGQQGTGRSSS
jgi:AcrR family transcriptional regulator